MSESLFEFVKMVWQYQPAMIYLLVVGFFLFLFLVTDVHRVRKSRDRQRISRYHR